MSKLWTFWANKALCKWQRNVCLLSQDSIQSSEERKGALCEWKHKKSYSKCVKWKRAQKWLKRWQQKLSTVKVNYGLLVNNFWAWKSILLSCFFVHAHQAHARVKQPSAICLIQQGRQQGMEMQTRMPFVLLTALFWCYGIQNESEAKCDLI